LASKLQDIERAFVAAHEAGNVEDAKRLAQAVVTLRSGQHTPVSPLDGMSGGEQYLAGMGAGMKDLGRGVGQRLGFVSQGEVDEARKMDAPLTQGGAGAAGHITGQMAAMLPTLAIPGANTVAGAAAIGGLSGLAQPTAEGESAIENAFTGAALGGGAQAGIGKLAGWAGKKLAQAEASGVADASRNAVKDATLQASRGAGYVVPPSLSEAGTGARVLEGISGKIKTQQLAAVKNQNVTERLARKAMGMSDDAPITADAMQGIRNDAYARGYEPVAKVGAFETDKTFQKTLDNIAADYKGASRSFGRAVNNEVGEMVDSLRVGAFDAGDAIKMTRILREDANKAYASGDKALGKATRKASDAIEDQIERGLASAGKDGAEMLKNFREARALMAKAHSVERALREGGGIDAKVFGQMLRKHKPLTDELRTIGLFANNFPEVAGMPKAGWSNPVTALDAFGAAGMAGMGMGPLGVALPAARLGARQGLLSAPAQRAMAPQYGPGASQKIPTWLLEEMERRGAGGLLGSINSPQQ
jgi:hypothetical protein